MEAAYGGASNLEDVSGARQRRGHRQGLAGELGGFHGAIAFRGHGEGHCDAGHTGRRGAGYRAPAGFGNVGTVAPGTGGKSGWLPVTFLPGMVVYADSSAGTTGPQLLYQAIGAGNLRAFVDGQDSVGHAAVSN